MNAHAQAALACVDPRDLTRTDRLALELIHDHTPSRKANGYRAGLHRAVSLKTAQRLIHSGLARLDYSSTRGVRLMLTGAGLNAYGVMQMRRNRRKS